MLRFFLSLLPSCKTVPLKEFKVISSYKGETIISSYMRNFYFEFHVGILAICFDSCCEIFPGEGEWGGMGGKFILFSSLRQEIQLKKLVDQIFVVFNLKNKKKRKQEILSFLEFFLLSQNKLLR